MSKNLRQDEVNEMVEQNPVSKVEAGSQEILIHLADGTIIEAYFTIHDQMEYRIVSD